MTKQDFLDKLRRALTGEVNADVIQENIRFYDEYFMIEERKGRTEQEILAELGEPRLLAKTIIDTTSKENGAYCKTSYEEESFDQEENTGEKRTFRTLRLPMWLILGAVVIILILLTVGVGALVIKLLILLPVLLILYLWNVFQNR